MRPERRRRSERVRRRDDFHLIRARPAIGRGNPDSHPAMDFDGQRRPTGVPVDAGADQREPVAIVVGRSIGAVRLGMPKANVAAFYGETSTTFVRAGKAGRARAVSDRWRTPDGHVRRWSGRGRGDHEPVPPHAGRAGSRRAAPERIIVPVVSMRSVVPPVDGRLDNQPRSLTGPNGRADRRGDRHEERIPNVRKALAEGPRCRLPGKPLGRASEHGRRATRAESVEDRDPLCCGRKGSSNLLGTPAGFGSALERIGVDVVHVRVEPPPLVNLVGWNAIAAMHLHRTIQPGHPFDGSLEPKGRQLESGAGCPARMGVQASPVSDRVC